jgi:predicted lipoprotein
MKPAVKTFAVSAFVVCAIAALGACNSGDSGSSTPAPSRAEVVATVNRDVIVPAYADLAAKADALLTATKAACAAPADAAKRTAAQDAWRATDDAWAKTRAFRYGPTKTMRSVTRIDYPVDPEKVEALRAGSEPISSESLAKVGADRRGLGAVEIVLFEDAPLDARSCELAIGATTLVTEATDALVEDWKTDAPDGEMAIEDGVNGVIFALADIGDMQLAKAAGLASGQPAPADVDGGPAQNALGAMTATLDGVDDAWTKGYRPLVAGMSSDTAEKVDDQLAAVRTVLDEIPAPLAAVRDSAPVNAAYESVRDALVTLRTEVASQLGVTLQLSDSDGDS